MKHKISIMTNPLLVGSLFGLALGLGACDDGSSGDTSGSDAGEDGGSIEDIVNEMAGNTVRMDPDVAAGGVEEWWLGLDASPQKKLVACNCNQQFPEATWTPLGPDSLKVEFPNGATPPPTETYVFYDTASDGRSGAFDVTIVNAIETIEMSGTWTLIDGTDVCPAPPC